MKLTKYLVPLTAIMLTTVATLQKPSTVSANEIKENIDQISTVEIEGQTYRFLPSWAKQEENDGDVITKVGSKIPTIFITTQSGDLTYIHEDKSNREKVEFLFVDEDGNIEHSGSGDMNGRGNSTWGYDKRPYNFRLESGVKMPLYGMGEGRHWSLLANYIDGTKVRNNITLNLAQEMGIAFTSQIRPVDIYINNEYMGIYDLVERRNLNHAVHLVDLEKATEKVNDNDLEDYDHVGTHESIPNTIKYFDIPNNPEDITGGYLMELELVGRYMTAPSGFVSSRGQSVNLENPEIATKEQVEYISSLYQTMEDAIYSPEGYNEAGTHFSELIDIESFAKMYILQEFVMNVDASRTSFFLIKESDLVGDGKIHAAVPWDFDNIMGVTAMDRDVDLRNPTNWWVNNMTMDDSNITPSPNRPNILARLFMHDEFYEVVETIWQDEFTPIFEAFSIEMYQELIEDSRIMDELVWGEPEEQVMDIVAFANERFAFLDGYFGKDADNGQIKRLMWGEDNELN